MSQFAGLFKALKNEEEKATIKPSVSTEEKQARTESFTSKKSAPTKHKPKTSINKSPAQDKNRESAVVTKQPGPISAKKAETKVMLSVEEKTGRSRGKSSNPEYTQVLSYIRKSTYKDVRRALLDKSEQDFSELIENLLSEWLTNRN